MRGTGFDRSSRVTWASVAVLSCLTGVLLPSGGDPRAAVAFAVAVLIGAIAVKSPATILCALPVWLVALGTLRRLTNGLTGDSPTSDPLLAVVPVAFVILGIVAVNRRAFAHRTPLTAAVFALMALLALSALNPAQGGLTVGVAGAVVTVAPMLAFLVGRVLMAHRVFVRVLATVAFLSVPAAAYGLYQAFIRFPTWDQKWIEDAGYVALSVGGTIRPFGSFVSGQEFGTYVAVGFIVVLAFAGRGVAWKWAIPILLFLFTGVWFESARLVLIMMIAGGGVVFCARAGWSVTRALLAGTLLLASLPFVTTQLAPERFGDDARGNLARHQFDGLSDPFSDESTAAGHIDRAVGGIRAAFTEPLGTGVGAISIASDKFGGSFAGTEVDIGNVGVAAGLPGLLAFTFVLWHGLKRAYSDARRNRDPTSYAVIGVLVVTLLQWLNGGMYSVIWLPWLVLGWLDRPQVQVELVSTEAAEVKVDAL